LAIARAELGEEGGVISFGVLRMLLLCALALSVPLSGCGKRGPKLYPVKGQVFFMDQPAAGAQIVFQPAGGLNAAGSTSSGTVQADGSFTLQTYPHGEGAPAGDYNVLISWMPENARELENPKNKLPAKYGDSMTPLLKATVKEGPNDLPPFRLTK
jgi:hypothetical protein